MAPMTDTTTTTDTDTAPTASPLAATVDIHLAAYCEPDPARRNDLIAIGLVARWARSSTRRSRDRGTTASRR